MATEIKAYSSTEAADRNAKLERDVQEARIKAERDKVEAARRAVEEAERKVRQEAEDKARAERQAAEAKAKAEREAEEAKQREIQRQANELLDGRGMLETFVKKYGHREEFLLISAAIKAFLQ